jgi:hypothetical protein
MKLEAGSSDRGADTNAGVGKGMGTAARLLCDALQGEDTGDARDKHMAGMGMVGATWL